LHMFESLIKPIVAYGSEVWGHNNSARSEIDKLFLRFTKQTLRVKSTTSNIVIFGECGIMPPSIQCITSTLCYMNRLHNMPDHLIVKQAYNELRRLHDNGFDTWIKDVCELERMYNLDTSMNVREFKNICKRVLKESFISKWHENLTDLVRNPILRTYIRIKHSFKQENYLKVIKDKKYRIALTRFRTSSHTLEIERGRHDRPKKPVQARLCSTCSIVEDEQHLLCECKINCDLRAHMYSKIGEIYLDFFNLNNDEKFVFLMKTNDHRIMNWLGKFVYRSFEIRDSINTAL